MQRIAYTLACIFYETWFRDIKQLFPAAFDLDWQRRKVEKLDISSTERALGVSLAFKTLTLCSSYICVLFFVRKKV